MATLRDLQILAQRAAQQRQAMQQAAAPRPTGYQSPNVVQDQGPYPQGTTNPSIQDATTSAAQARRAGIDAQRRMTSLADRAYQAGDRTANNEYGRLADSAGDRARAAYDTSRIYASQMGPVRAEDLGTKGRLKGDSDYAKGITAVGYSQQPNAGNFTMDQSIRGIAGEGYLNAMNALGNYGRNQDYANYLASRGTTAAAAGALQGLANDQGLYGQDRAFQMNAAQRLGDMANQDYQSVIAPQIQNQQEQARRQALSTLASSYGANNPAALRNAIMSGSDASTQIAANALPALAQEQNNFAQQRLAAQNAYNVALQGLGGQQLQNMQQRGALLGSAGQLYGNLGQQDLSALGQRNQSDLGYLEAAKGWAGMGLNTNAAQLQANMGYDEKARQFALQKLAMLQGQKVDPSIFQSTILPAIGAVGQTAAAVGSFLKPGA